MDEIQGFIDHFIFQSDKDGYKIMSFSTSEEDIIVVGTFPGIDEGENLVIQGEYIEHATYGRQFKAHSYKVSEPTDIASIERYLASGAIKGIGKVTAKRIIAKFKDDTLRIMEEEPDKLAKVKGISLKKAIAISDQIIEKKELRDVIIFLDGYGIKSNMALRIYGEYGNSVYSIIRENPYRLADDIDGIGFKTADKIALKMNIALDSDFRIRSAIIYGLTEGAARGHTFIRKENLSRVVEQLLEIEIDSLDAHLMNLVIDKRIVVKEDRVYLTYYYQMEMRCADMLLKLDNTFYIEDVKFEEAIARVEERQNIELDSLQKDAVKVAIKSGVCVLTGGPGTGKTTTIKTMIEFFELEGLDIFLAAPTGRAAKRMTEATGRGARTIHRMLEVKGASDSDNGAAFFDRNEDNPLECDVIIIDEMSMVDIGLYYNLLRAIEPGVRLIMVGDTNQLPSVGAGNVLKDIIASDAFPVVTLDKVFRQSNESDIVTNAYKINGGEHVVLDNKSKDFFFMERGDVSAVINTTIDLVKNKLPKYVDAPSEEIQVLTPSKKNGLLCSNELNKVLQERLNPPSSSKRVYEYGDRVFREGDKVMQIKNNYQIEWKEYSDYNVVVESGTGVFNGDMGVVTMIDVVTKTLRVMFDDNRSVDYQFSQLDELEHAYAVTVHKSQGSEYPAVVITLLRTPVPLMIRNILYTAVTRAKKCVVIVGDKDVFYRMVDNEEIDKRNSSLDTCIIELGSN